MVQKKKDIYQDSNYESHNSDVNIDAERLYYSHKYINELSEVFDNLSNTFNIINIQCSEISSLSLLDSAKTSISNMNSCIINDLKTNINNVTDIIKESDNNIKMLFDYMDNGELLEEDLDIGDYISDGNIEIEKLQEDYFEQADKVEQMMEEMRGNYENARKNDAKKEQDMVSCLQFFFQLNNNPNALNQSGDIGELTRQSYNNYLENWKNITGEELPSNIDEAYTEAMKYYDNWVPETEELTSDLLIYENVRNTILDNAYSCYLLLDDTTENLEFKTNIADYEEYNEEARRGNTFFDSDGNIIPNVSKYEKILYWDSIGEDLTKRADGHTYAYMTETEKNVVKYLYNKGKTEELDKFFQYKQAAANSRHGKELADAVINSYSDKDVLITMGILSGNGLLDGINQFFDGLENLVAADGIISPEQYKSSYILEDLNKRYGEGWKNIATSASYEISSSIGNMLPSIVLSKATFGLLNAAGGVAGFLPTAKGLLEIKDIASIVGATSMGLSAAGNARESGLQNGMETSEAWIYGILTGLSEAGLERIMGGIPGISTLDTTFFGKMLAEGTEESLQEILDPLFISVVTGAEYDIDVDAVIKSGIYGMMTAGLLNGGEIVINSDFKCDLSVLPKEKCDAVLAAISTEFAGLDMTNIENQQILMDTLRTYGLTIEEINLNTDIKTELSNIELFNIESSIKMKIETLGYDISDMSITEIMKNYPDIYTETLSEYGITESVHKSSMLNEIIGQDLYSWVPNIDTANTLFNNLQTACDNAGIDIYDPIVLKSLTTLDAFKKYYEDARSIVENNNTTTDPNKIVKDATDLETYRTHGVIHIIDVMTQSINCYSAFSKAGINGLDLETITLAAVMHDTGMSGGLEIKINKDTNTIEVNSATKNAKTYRESHSYNSGVNTLENYQKLQEIGYTDVQIAEASLLAFAHSKSNSGLSPLSNNASGWSFALDALAIASEQGNFGFDIIGVLEEAGIVSTSNSSNQSVKVKTPTQGKLEFEYHEYEFNQEWLTKMAYEGLILRIGDAATNNDNGMTNQFGDVITIIDDYGNQIDITTLSSTESMVNLIKENIKNNLKKEIGKNEWEALSKEEQTRLINEEYNTKYKDDIINLNLDSLSQSERTIQLMKYLIDEKITLETLAEVEASDLSFSVGETEMSKSQQFVLGEHNQTYRVETNQDGNVDMIISVKESEAVPFCTLFAIEERLGELNSKGNGIFSAASDGKEIKLIIEIDESTSHNITYLYEQFANYYSASDTSGKKVNIEIRMVNRK